MSYFLRIRDRAHDQNNQFRAAVKGLEDREKGAAREATFVALVTVSGSPSPVRVVRCIPCNVSDKDSGRELFEADIPPLLVVPLPDWEEAETLLPIEERGGCNGDDNDDGARRDVWMSSFARPLNSRIQKHNTPPSVSCPPCRGVPHTYKHNS